MKRVNFFKVSLYFGSLFMALSSNMSHAAIHNNIFSALGLRSDAQEHEVRSAYHKVARELHPDKTAGSSDAAEKAARLAQINGLFTEFRKARSASSPSTASTSAAPSAAPVNRAQSPVRPTAFASSSASSSVAGNSHPSPAAGRVSGSGTGHPSAQTSTNPPTTFNFTQMMSAFSTGGHFKK